MYQKYYWRLLQEKVVDLFPDEGSESEKLSVYPMEDSLEKVSLSGILTIEEFQELQHKFLVDHLLADAWLKVGRFQKSQEKLVYQLQWSDH